jgi:flagellar biosynthesis component FlhA
MDVPVTLRQWFVAHAAVDAVVGLPLLFVPGLVLTPLGWGPVDQVSTRLVGAAMLAIGAQSYLGRNAGVEVYKAMLNLKVVWSFAAILGLGVAIAHGAPPAAFAFLSAFIALAGVWSHYRIRFKQLAAAVDHDFPADEGVD